jgi:membrane fusion protein
MSQMSQQLFRREVLEARRAGALGGVSLAQSPGPWMLTAMAITAALVIVLFLLFGSYTRRSPVSGQLVPTLGLSTVLSPAAGVVEQLRVTEGARVTAGQLLAIITVPRVSITSGPAAAEVETSLRAREAGLQSARLGQRHSFAAQAAGLQAQLDTARGELALVEAQLVTRQQQIRIGEDALARLRELQAQHFVSPLQLQQQESTLLDQVGAMQALQLQGAALHRSLAQLEQAARELPGQQQVQEAGAQRELAALAQERVEMQAAGAVMIAAPVAGVVAAQIIKPGQAVQMGQPLLSVLPGDGGLEAELLVPSRAVGFIAPGDRVLLRYQAFPWQKFGHQQGRIARISRSALGPEELGALAGMAGGNQPLYRVTVTLARQAITAYGRAEALKPGMLLDADILGETRRLAEWLFEPLYSLRGKLGES